MIIIIEYFNSFFRILNHPLNKDQKLKAAFRILWWKFNQLFLHIPSVITLSGSNIKCVCYPESSYSGMVVYNNLPEYPEMLFLGKVLKPQSVFLDVGANIGVFTLMAASKIKSGKIYSFEPVASVLSILHNNVRLNNLEDRVTIVEKVASDQTGYERFVSHEISEYSHISVDKSSKTVRIPSIRLDTFCKENKINFIDVVKIDVEGAELKVLKGMEDYLKFGKVGFLIVELNKRNILFEGGSNQVIDYLTNFGYRIYKIKNDLKLKKLHKMDPNITLNVIAVSNGVKYLP